MSREANRLSSLDYVRVEQVSIEHPGYRRLSYDLPEEPVKKVVKFTSGLFLVLANYVIQIAIDAYDHAGEFIEPSNQVSIICDFGPVVGQILRTIDESCLTWYEEHKKSSRKSEPTTIAAYDLITDETRHRMRMRFVAPTDSHSSTKLDVRIASNV